MPDLKTGAKKITAMYDSRRAAVSAAVRAGNIGTAIHSLRAEAPSAVEGEGGEAKYGSTNTIVTQEKYEAAKERLGKRKPADILRDEQGAVDPGR